MSVALSAAVTVTVVIVATSAPLLLLAPAVVTIGLLWLCLGVARSNDRDRGWDLVSEMSGTRSLPLTEPERALRLVMSQSSRWVDIGEFEDDVQVVLGVAARITQARAALGDELADEQVQAARDTLVESAQDACARLREARDRRDDPDVETRERSARLHAATAHLTAEGS